MNARGIGIGLMALTLTACGPAMKTAWVKDGASRQDFDRDRYACAVAHQPGWSIPGWGLLGLMSADDAEDRAEEMRRRCLRAQGWHRAKLPETSPDGFEADDVRSPAGRRPTMKTLVPPGKQTA
jgi:hypothetical protein